MAAARGRFRTGPDKRAAPSRRAAIEALLRPPPAGPAGAAGRGLKQLHRTTAAAAHRQPRPAIRTCKQSCSSKVPLSRGCRPSPRACARENRARVSRVRTGVRARAISAISRFAAAQLRPALNPSARKWAQADWSARGRNLNPAREMRRKRAKIDAWDKKRTQKSIPAMQSGGVAAADKGASHLLT